MNSAHFQPNKRQLLCSWKSNICAAPLFCFCTGSWGNSGCDFLNEKLCNHIKIIIIIIIIIRCLEDIHVWRRNNGGWMCWILIKTVRHCRWWRPWFINRIYQLVENACRSACRSRSTKRRARCLRKISHIANSSLWKQGILINAAKADCRQHVLPLNIDVSAAPSDEVTERKNPRKTHGW